MDWIVDSLEKCAEQESALISETYGHFFETCPAAVELMGHSDEHMRARMMSQVFELMMDANPHDSGGYLAWEVDNHVTSYNVPADLYPAFFASLQHAMAHTLAEQWQPEHAQAWEQRCNSTLAAIKRFTH